MSDQPKKQELPALDTFKGLYSLSWKGAPVDVYLRSDVEAFKKAAQSAEAKLRAVSEALEETPRKVPAGQFHKAELVSSPNDVDALLAKLRAIVEGKC